MEYADNPQLRLAFDFVQHTGRNIFLTGKAGTGKTTFLRNLTQVSPKRMIVVAPTGVAAINAGGVTIHSFFQMPFGPHIPVEKKNFDQQEFDDQSKVYGEVRRFSREKINIIKSLDLLIIDEISMVRADLLDGIDEVLRQFRGSSKPFGGVQLLMIGDVQQLAPIAKDDEWEILRQYYDSVYFFSSRALQKTSYISIELKHIYRQSDRDFIDLLNKVRENNVDQETLNRLNMRYVPGINQHENEGYITLTTHNHQSQRINESRLGKLKTSEYRFRARVNGEFPEYSYPTDYELVLKVGAQVMFVKNDTSPLKEYYNGKIGSIVDIDGDIIRVECPGDEDSISVGMVEWQNMRYTIDNDTKEIREEMIGSFIQYPLKLAWAITIHKSQGLTFEKGIIDAQASFAHGQVYVALSRCKTLEGMVLSSPISPVSIKNDTSVLQFCLAVEQNPPTERQLMEAKTDFQNTLIFELFDFKPLQRRINYCIKLLRENAGIVFGNIHADFNQITTDFKVQILDVNEKFANQLQQLTVLHKNIEGNPILQERIQKACTYYSEKIEAILLPILSGMTFESDNKTVRKYIASAIGKLRDEAIVKLACLKACQGGFMVKTYMDARAKATIDQPEYKASKRKEGEPKPQSNAHPVLYERLKEWRNARFNELKIPAYTVLPQKALLEIVEVVPQSISELQSIKGFGKKRARKYGSDILSIIAEYRKETGMPVDPSVYEEIAENSQPKLNSKQQSYNLFAQGKSIEDIARERDMAISTVEGHLAGYVKSGDIAINRLVSPEKIDRITSYFLNAGNYNLSPAKEALGDEVTYSELRFVLNHLIGRGEIPIA